MRALLVCCALLLAASTQAQPDLTTPGIEGAEAAVRAYIDAFSGGDWEAAGRVIDPNELEVMSELVGFLAVMDTTGQMLRGGDDTDNVLLFAHFMETLMGEESMFGDMVSSIQVMLLGSVADGDSLVHVVGRSTTRMFDSDISNVEVTTARWLGDRWAVLLNAQLRGMTQAMQQMGEMFGDLDGEEEFFLEEEWDDDEWEDGGDEDGSDG